MKQEPRKQTSDAIRARIEEVNDLFRAVDAGTFDERNYSADVLSNAAAIFEWIVRGRTGDVRIPVLYPGTAAQVYETTPENLEATRAAMEPGQLWVRVWGPGIGKLEGVLEWRLRALGAAGGDVSIKRQGRSRDPKVAIECAQLKDEGWTYAQIGERFNWPLRVNSTGTVTGCRTAEEYVRYGRKLRDHT